MNSPDYTNAPRKNRDALHLAKVQVNTPIKFANYSSNKAENYSGYGLQSITPISKDSQVIKISPQMGLVSNILVDNEGSGMESGDEDLVSKIMENTDKVS